MASAPQRYPLAWPAHRPRTDSWRRKPGRFSRDGRAITMFGANDRLQQELDRLSALYPVLSTNVELRLDGQPRSNQRAPIDPGACVYFTLKGKPFALACDTYNSVEQNFAALAAHLEATRAIERHGVASAAETLEAFSALPPPTGAQPARARTWRQVFDFGPDFPAGFSDEEAALIVSRRFRDQAVKSHPDKPGGSQAAMAELTAARDAALQELKAK